MRRNGRCILLALVFLTAPAHAQERLRASWSGSTPTNAPVWVAVEGVATALAEEAKKRPEAARAAPASSIRVS